MGPDGGDEDLRDPVCDAFSAVLCGDADVQDIAQARGMLIDEELTGLEARTGRDEMMAELRGRLCRGESLRLMCWCHPKRCHGVAIAEKLRQLSWQPLSMESSL